MRIFKVRWWIPISLMLFLATSFFVIVYLDARRARQFEKSAGLGAVAWDPVHMWAQRPSLFSYFRSQPGPMAVVPSAVPPNTEDYSAPSEEGFLDTATHRLSTFGIDVDTASYSNVRRFLNEDERPPEGAVRIEELLNYFSYSYPDPAGPHPFSVTTELAPCPWAPGHRLLRVGLKSKPVDVRNLPPSHLTFLVDVSGSMANPAKLPLVKQSFALLIEQLRPEDSVAIVVYAGNAGLVLPPTTGSQKTVLMEAISRLEAGGSTAGGEGIQLAYTTARAMYRQSANNRVILATDGDFNVGVSSDDDLIRLIESERDHGIYLTVLGFGMGNLKDAKLEKLADHGNGHYAYVDSILEARRVFVEQIGATLLTVAKDVKLQLEFNPARVAQYRLLGYENRRLTAEEFRDDRKDAGELGAGHTVTALYELIPFAADPLADDSYSVRVRYKQPESNYALEMSASSVSQTAAPSADFRFAAAVAQFGMLLSNSKHKGEASFASAIALAESSITGDERRADFLSLLNKASKMPNQPK